MGEKNDSRLVLSEEDKEELFADFLLRFSEMDKDEKRLSAAKNTSAMKDLTRYWESKASPVRSRSEISEDKQYLYREFDGRMYYAADGIYNAYLAIRKVVPFAVGCKRSLQGHEIAGSHAGYRKVYVLDPDKDRDEATEIGKRLIDTLLDYLKESDS